jgi:glycosyltransferase involved in cell wall biosynthesis
MTAKVSVLVLSYNAERFIADAINSVLHQSYQNLEIVIGDDCSSDRTLEVIRAVACSSEVPIHILKSPTNQGITNNFNKCLKHCSGDYIFLLGGDDIYLPGKLAAQVAFMDSNPSIAISYHDVSVFNSDTGRHMYYYNKDRHGFHHGGASLLVTQGTFNCGCATAVRNENLPVADSEVCFSSDWLWYIETLVRSQKRIDYFPGVHARYRRHGNNVTGKSHVDEQFKDTFTTLAKVQSRYPELKQDCVLAAAERNAAFGLKQLWAGEWRKGASCLAQRSAVSTGLYLLLKRRLLKRVN